MFQPLTGLYEPSSIQQLADGRFLVVEDEKSHPFSLVTISAAGDVSSTPLLPPEGDDAAWKLDDLEALALDRAGFVYALTSHSRNAKGNEKKARDKLVRFRIEDGRMVEPMLVRGLKPALVAAHPELAAAAGIRRREDRRRAQYRGTGDQPRRAAIAGRLSQSLARTTRHHRLRREPRGHLRGGRATPHRARPDYAGSGRRRDSQPVPTCPPSTATS